MNENLREIKIKGYVNYDDKATKLPMIRVISEIEITKNGKGIDSKMYYFEHTPELEQKIIDYLDGKYYKSSIKYEENFNTNRIKIIDLIIK